MEKGGRNAARNKHRRSRQNAVSSDGSRGYWDTIIQSWNKGGTEKKNYPLKGGTQRTKLERGESQ